ncbi:MAG: winged helix DNA-binding domain-containing protein [Candidatus Limnocylindrales bacterium]
MTRPPAGATLDRRTLNRTLLARQHLLERVDRPIGVTIEGLVGLQAQVPRDPYISLWSRLRGFDPAELEALILERRAVRMTLMRTTLHLVTADDATALRPVLQDVCERGFRSSPFRRRLDGVDLDELLAVGAAIATARPRTISELGSLLGERWPQHDRTAMAYAVRYLVPLVQVPPRGLWTRSGAPRVTTLATWLDLPGEPVVPQVAPPDEVVLRYLRAFGPASAADIRTWSWLNELRAVIERLRPHLRAYRDEAGRELLDVEDGIFADGHVDAPVRFLGEYDNLFLSHADRSRVTSELAWGASFVRQGAFFVDGFLAGAWRASDLTGRATLSIDSRVPLAAARDEVVAEGEALLRFLAPAASSRTVDRAAG